MKRTFDLKSSSGALARAFAITATLACAVPLACSDSGHRSGQGSGSVAMQLTLPDGSQIAAIEYSITGNSISPITGSVPVGNSTTVAFQVGGIPVGTGYTLALTATTSTGQACSGSAIFDIVAGQVNAVSVAINCGQANTSGNVHVEVEINRCAIVTSLSALPVEVLVGGTIALSAAASSPDASFAWSASAGAPTQPSAASTNYPCAVPGTHTITVAVNGGGPLCTTPDTRTVTVTSTDPGSGGGGDAGASVGGSGGTSAGGGGSGGGTPTEVSAPFVDAGQFVVQRNASTGALTGSQRFGNASSYQSLLVGQQATVERRSYIAFDVSGVEGAVSAATLRIWGWKPFTLNANTGLYNSVHDEETFVLQSVDSYTVANIQAQAFAQSALGDGDEDIFADLGDGTLFGSIVLTPADETTDLIPPPGGDPSVDCSEAEAQCGKWVAISLNAAALTAINASVGEFILGGSVSSIAGTQLQQVFGGSQIDNAQVATPAPQLILTVE